MFQSSTLQFAAEMGDLLKEWEGVVHNGTQLTEAQVQNFLGRVTQHMAGMLAISSDKEGEEPQRMFCNVPCLGSCLPGMLNEVFQVISQRRQGGSG